MTLPNAERAIVPREKLVGYLLSKDHPIGRYKAQVLAGCGYNIATVDTFASGLMEIAREGELTNSIETQFGWKYTVDGMLPCSGKDPLRLRTVWIVEKAADARRLVTAYPAS